LLGGNSCSQSSTAPKPPRHPGPNFGWGGPLPQPPEKNPMKSLVPPARVWSPVGRPNVGWIFFWLPIGGAPGISRSREMAPPIFPPSANKRNINEKFLRKAPIGKRFPLNKNEANRRSRPPSPGPERGETRNQAKPTPSMIPRAKKKGGPPRPQKRFLSPKRAGEFLFLRFKNGKIFELTIRPPNGPQKKGRAPVKKQAARISTGPGFVTEMPGTRPKSRRFKGGQKPGKTKWKAGQKQGSAQDWDEFESRFHAP